MCGWRRGKGQNPLVRVSKRLPAEFGEKEPVDGVDLFTAKPREATAQVKDDRGGGATWLERRPAKEREAERGGSSRARAKIREKGGNRRGDPRHTIYSQRKRRSAGIRGESAAEELGFTGKIEDKLHFESTRYTTEFAPILEGKKRGG
uniref:DUF834 domain-containing protein n=1 Tax=Oryza barthii TaxID=65489 RepID=A0A0D3HT24_9ORYZ